MILKPPFEISSRLLPAVRVNGAFLSLGISGRTTRDGRALYECWIDLPDGSEHEITDLHSGCQGGSVQEGMAALLSFLSAAAESRQYRERNDRPGENEDLFSVAIVDWASENSDELGMLSCELDETPNLIED